jgi:galactose mutarotase-like enzyme
MDEMLIKDLVKKNILTVDPNGGRIQLTLDNTSMLTMISRGDGKTGITHPCSPIFDEDRNNVYGLLGKHGKMRDSICKLSHPDQDKIIIEHDVEDFGYPKGITAKQVLEIEGSIFTLSFTHQNNGNQETAVNAGEHCYFDAPQGYKGTLINNIDISRLIEENPNGTGIELLSKNIIQIPGKPKILLQQNGFNKAFIWVGRNKKGIIDKNYICIEPIEFHPDEFGQPKTKIGVGMKRTAWLSFEWS